MKIWKRSHTLAIEVLLPDAWAYFGNRSSSTVGGTHALAGLEWFLPVAHHRFIPMCQNHTEVHYSGIDHISEANHSPVTIEVGNCQAPGLVAQHISVALLDKPMLRKGLN